MTAAVQPVADELLACVRCKTDTLGDGWVLLDNGWHCDACHVLDVDGQPVPVDQAVECAGSSVLYPTWHHEDDAMDCGACRDDAAREQQYESARDAEYDHG